MITPVRKALLATFDRPNSLKRAGVVGQGRRFFGVGTVWVRLFAVPEQHKDFAPDFLEFKTQLLQSDCSGTAAVS